MGKEKHSDGKSQPQREKSKLKILLFSGEGEAGERGSEKRKGGGLGGLGGNSFWGCRELGVFSGKGVRHSGDWVKEFLALGLLGGFLCG